MMYLCDEIIDSKANAYAMVGILNQKASMENMKLKLGYRKVSVNDQTYFGHEFHYSNLVNAQKEFSVGEIYSARNKKMDTLLFKKNNVIASYVHFYWGEKNILDLF